MGSSIRTRLFTIGFLLNILLSLSACTEKPEGHPASPLIDVVSGLDPEKLSALILLKASDSLYFPTGLYDHRLTDSVKYFYKQNKGEPVWLGFLKDSSFKRRILDQIRGVQDHGFKSAWYNYVLIKNGLTRFDSLKRIRSDADYQFLSDLDFTISVTMTGIYKDLALGRIDPWSFYKPSYSLPFSRGKDFNLYAVLQNPWSFDDSIMMRVPCSVRYHTLQVMYKQYSDYLREHRLMDIDTSEEINSDHNRQVVLQRLELLWLKPPVKRADIQSNFDDYIFRTRRLYFMPPGGVDSALVSRLCVPSGEVLYEVLCALERERWFSHPDTGHYLLVNIPDFKVYLHNDTIGAIKVCVGKRKPDNYAELLKEYLKTKNYKRRPINSETPLIGSAVTEIIINPTWTVPNSIIGKEMYSQIVANPGYLTRKGFEVLVNGKVVSPYSVPWRKYQPYQVPVKIRQKAGPNNSLGILKFNFPNPHNVYMHDTPEKGKFNLSVRAISHGCIRLHQPQRMAEFLLGLQNDSTAIDRFRLKMGLQPYDTLLQVEDSLLKPIKTTESVRLKKPVPVYVDYRTLVIERSGEMRILPDIYRRNRVLGRQLSK